MQKTLLNANLFGSCFLLSWVMIVLFPLSLLGADSGAAMLHSKGGVYVNGTEVVNSAAIFPGDLLETKAGFAANLDAEGSSVLIQPDSVVKFQGTFLVLDHGTVSVGTSTSMSVLVNCLKVEPVSGERTQYDVTDISGAVQILALKNDVSIKHGGALQKATNGSESPQAGTLSTTVKQGQTVKREVSEACGPAKRPGTVGNIGNTKLIEIGAGTGVGALVLCLIFCKGSGGTSVSPWQP